MATKLPPIPIPPPPEVARIDKSGRPTEALVIYETKLKVWLEGVKAFVEAAP